MPKSDPGARIRNMARGGETYRHLRWRVHAALKLAPERRAAPISPFLARTFFALRTARRQHLGQNAEPFEILALSSRDLQILEELNGSKNDDALELAYFNLAIEYIISHSSEIRRLEQIEAALSRGVLSLDPDALAAAFTTANDLDRQSLFVFKLYAALFSETPQSIADYFAQQPHSQWVRKTLLYPLIYKAINLSDDVLFSEVLGQAIPELATDHNERLAVQFLLRDEPDSSYSLAYCCYMTLLCHPYDALSMICSFFERRVAAGSGMKESHARMLRHLASKLPSSRLTNLVGVIGGHSKPWVICPSSFPVGSRLKFDQESCDFLEKYWRIPSANSEGRSWSLRTLNILSRLRESAYPQEKDFLDATALAQRYGFSEIGRLLRVLLTGIYMVERSSPETERLHLLRQLDFAGVHSPFTYCSPRGADTLRFVSVEGGPETEDETDRIIEGVRQSELQGRWWLKALHWRLRKLQRGMRVAEWLSEVRANVRLSGNSRFLSGIDWAWIDDVIRVARIQPFAGRPDGIYVLLMRAMEQRQREPNALRLALNPFRSTQHDGVLGLVRRLAAEFGPDTVAFTRFFLTPAVILKMRLETNYTAALSGRLDALDYAIGQFGFDDDVMTREQFDREQLSLTTALTFTAVGAAQFEISWEAFKADAKLGVDDEYRTFEALGKTYNSIPLLSKARRDTTHTFINKEVRRFVFQNSDWPLVLCILRMVDMFLSHPSYGIEAILAIRIRHDNLRQEFAIALAELRRTAIPFVSLKAKRACLDRFETIIYSVLQPWIDKYMHTKRGSDHALFDVIPNQQQLGAMLKSLGSAPSKDHLVDEVSTWICARLEHCLIAAREKVRDELRPAILESIERACNSIHEIDKIPVNIIRQVALATNSRLEGKFEDLAFWFSSPIQARKEAFNLGQIKMAVDGRFAQEVSRGKLIVSFDSLELKSTIVIPEHIRSMFDLWSELTQNALKYGRKDKVVARVSFFVSGDQRWCAFSTLCSEGAIDETFYTAEALSANEPVLKKGQSGLFKVASLCAAIRGREVSLKVVRRRFSHHVIMPIPARALH